MQSHSIDAVGGLLGRIGLVHVDLEVVGKVDLQVAEAALEHAAAPPLLIDGREAQAARVDRVRRQGGAAPRVPPALPQRVLEEDVEDPLVDTGLSQEGAVIFGPHVVARLPFDRAAQPRALAEDLACADEEARHRIGVVVRGQQHLRCSRTGEVLRRHTRDDPPVGLDLRGADLSAVAPGARRDARRIASSTSSGCCAKSAESNKAEPDRAT